MSSQISLVFKDPLSGLSIIGEVLLQDYMFYELKIKVDGSVPGRAFKNIYISSSSFYFEIVFLFHLGPVRM
jgi:hypothetical protein